MKLSGLVLLGCCLMLQGESQAGKIECERKPKPVTNISSLSEWQAQTQMIFKAVKIECEGNPLRAFNIYCNIKAINWNLAFINMSVDLHKPLQNTIVRLQVLKKDYANLYKPFLIDVTINMCQVIERRNFIPYGVILYKILKQISNVNHSCPYTGTIRVRDGYMNYDALPPFPQGFYLFSLEFTDKNSTNSEYVGTAKVYFQSMETVKSKKGPKAKECI